MMAKTGDWLAGTATWRQNQANSGHTKCPGGARPAHVNPNVEQTTAAIGGKVAFVFADFMTRTLGKQQSNSIQ